MNELKVGLFTLIAGACFVYMTLRITAKNAGFGSFYEYKVEVQDASGIFENSVVRVAGIEAGFIETIELSKDKALITFQVKSELKVTENSVLSIKTVGFLGEKYLDLALGPPGPDRLEEGTLIKVQENVGIEGLAQNASEVLVDVKDISTKLREAISNERSDNMVKEILNEVLDAVSSVKRMAKTNEESINHIVGNLEDISDKVAFELDDTNKNSLLGSIKEIRPIMENLKQATGDLKEIIADVKAGKGTVGKLLRDDQVVEQVNETLTNVNKLVRRINNIEADISLYSGVNTNDGPSTELGVDLYPAPERFYRLGVVLNDFGPEISKSTRTTTSIDGGADTIEKKEEVDENALKFNLQIGRIYQRFGFRAGLIETSGGIGIDYFLNDWGLKFTSEIFDFGNDDGANLRLMTDVRIWNVVYGRLSFEDVLNETRSVTVSAGLRFTDEDLASLIGLVAQ
ncbi:MAG: MCE family protein [Halobacteriovoraceae bacterium]|nr:MCE family protein [Halobacteriovoraceae bacterium]MCB9094167.1 MCE family protein [Halobacteriovoraceae bacterium]